MNSFWNRFDVALMSLRNRIVNRSFNKIVFEIYSQECCPECADFEHLLCSDLCIVDCSFCNGVGITCILHGILLCSRRMSMRHLCIGSTEVMDAFRMDLSSHVLTFICHISHCREAGSAGNSSLPAPLRATQISPRGNLMRCNHHLLTHSNSNAIHIFD